MDTQAIITRINEQLATSSDKAKAKAALHLHAALCQLDMAYGVAPEDLTDIIGKIYPAEQEPAKAEPAEKPAAKAKAEKASVRTVATIDPADIDRYFRDYGSGFENGKKRIAEFYSHDVTVIEAVKFLKKEFGIGGSSFTYSDGTHGMVDHDGKGIEFRHFGSNDVGFTMTWPQVDTVLRLMVREGKYFTEKEIEAEKAAMEKAKAEQPKAEEPAAEQPKAAATLLDFAKALQG